MNRLRGLRGRLDPWAALLLGSIVTLTLVILLAMPGPWQKVVGIASRPTAAVNPPDEVAVFVLGRENGACSGIVWLHIDQERGSLTASVLPPQTEAFVAGGGCVPLNRIVDDLGPQTAAAALGEVLGVELDAWVTLDRDALDLAVPTMFKGGGERPRRELYVAAARAWEGRDSLAAAWPVQYQTLRSALPEVALDQINVVAFANYLLGFGIMQSELDLQATTAVADMLRTLTPDDVRVRALPATAQVSGPGEKWTLQAVPLAKLRHTLAVGLTPPLAHPEATVRQRAARVLVVTPDTNVDGATYAREVRRALARSAGVPVTVTLVEATPATLNRRVKAAVAAQRPLAVLVAPPRWDGKTEARVAALRKLGATLRRLDQPAVISLPLGVWSPTLDQTGGYAEVSSAIKATGLPTSRISASLVSDAETRVARARLAARANVQTLVRACWPSRLAPQLASTRSGFSYAAAQTVSVSVLGPTMAAAERAAARLRLWGYNAQAVSAGRWRPAAPEQQTAAEESKAGAEGKGAAESQGKQGGQERALYYRAGLRRPALALGGDLGLKRSLIVADAGAPSEVTLVLPGTFAEEAVPGAVSGAGSASGSSGGSPGSGGATASPAPGVAD